MSQSPEAQVSCANCNSDLPPEFGQDIAGKVCPVCGSKKLKLQLNFHDAVEVKVHSNMNAKVKDRRFSSKKNPRLQIFTGDDLRKSDGKWMKKDRVIDKEKNRYTEKVVDPETGEVVHHCDELLTDHYGHGSAKPKSDK